MTVVAPKKYKAKDGLPADIEEFGDEDLAGKPSVAQLIWVLPEDQREAYRQQHRAFIADLCEQLSIEPCTYAEYMRNETRRRAT